MGGREEVLGIVGEVREVWGDGGGEGGANLLNLTSCLAGWLVGWETLGEQTGQTGVCVSVCLCVHMSVFNTYRYPAKCPN